MQSAINDNRTSRRWLLAGTSAVFSGGLAAAAYRVSPSFWRGVVNDSGREVLRAPDTPAPHLWPDKGLHAAWLGHSTVLLKVDGFTILTDPVFSEKAGLNFGPVTLGIKRLVAPALALRKLPPVDLILLSHAHMDHFDIPSLRALEDKRRSVITASNTEDLLRVGRYQSVHPMRWGDAVQAGPVKVQAFEVNHWGARLRSDTWRGYNGYVLETTRYRVLFAGDTADTHTFQTLRSARGIDLAIMPIGAYNPWIRYHCNPEQSWRMANEARAQFMLPVHHQTFALGREPGKEPIERFVAAAGPAPDRVVLQNIGQEFHLS